MAQKKTYRAPLELKSEDRGAFVARFASIGPPPDADGDISVEGCFENGAKVPVGPFNHESGLPIGSGEITADDREALIRGRLYLNTDQGKATFETLRSMASEGMPVEWSYQFTIERSEPSTWNGQKVRRLLALDVWSVDPVLRGAGRNTALLALAKNLGGDAYDLSRIEGWGSESWVSKDPARALVQMRYHAAEMGVKLGGPRIPYDPGEARKVLALESGDPGELKALLEDELFKAAVSEIEGKLDGDTAPTNFDALRDQVRAAFGGDVSEAYVTTMARAHLADLVAQAQRNDSTITPRQARQQVARWARQAAS